MASELKQRLSKTYGSLELWEIIVIALFALFLVILGVSLWLSLRKKSKRSNTTAPPAVTQIPEEIKEIRVDHVSSNNNGFHHTLVDRFCDKDSEKALSEVAPTGWGHWFTLRDLQVATNHFSKDNIIGDGGYGVVYSGILADGNPVAVKKLLNNPGQADKDFRVEVEAIGNVRHKNLVRLLGYCMEGTLRMVVYEYVKNGNLEQWLHGDMCDKGYLTWEARIKVLIGTAKALAYLHEAIEPKVVHRDIKSSNILMDEHFEAKLSDFGLAKLLGADKSYITTRVMGTFGYVAPEYANSGLLNEKSDVYSFGVVVLEAITGRYPVDYGRPKDEVHMVEWVKMMVQQRRFEEVVEAKAKPSSTSALKRVLLTALRCVDAEAEKRPRMTQVVRMLDSDRISSHASH